MIGTGARSVVSPFNGPVENGLRALVLLHETYPDKCSLQRLVVYDYLIVHSDDIPGGPVGLHPQTPHRSAEMLVRRAALETGLLLYGSRGLVARLYTESGVMYVATDRSSSFLDALDSSYVNGLRERASWLVTKFGSQGDTELTQNTSKHIGEWGAEFTMESVLQLEGDSWQ